MAPTPTKPIPSFRRVAINDPSEMPDVYSSTPGGTLFSTTPGGSRIVYDRKFLMNLRDSPLSKTPPKIDFDVMPKVTGLDLLRKDQVFRSNVRRDVAVAADANNNAAANDSANLDDVQKQEKGKGSALFSQFEMEL